MGSHSKKIKKKKTSPKKIMMDEVLTTLEGWGMSGTQWCDFASVSKSAWSAVISLHKKRGVPYAELTAPNQPHTLLWLNFGRKNLKAVSAYTVVHDIKYINAMKGKKK